MLRIICTCLVLIAAGAATMPAQTPTSPGADPATIPARVTAEAEELLRAAAADFDSAAPEKPTEPATLALRVRAAWLRPGSTVDNALIVIERGVIKSIQAGGTAPTGMEVIELASGVAVPGLVLALSTALAPMGDAIEGMTPRAIAADSFDPFMPRPRMIRSGITTAYLSPGAERLVTGQGSVVRLGVPPEFSVLMRSSGLRANFGEGPRSTGPVFHPPLIPNQDTPIPAAEPQAPKTRGGAVAALRAAFGRARVAKEGSDDAIELEPLRRVLGGKLPLRIAADREADLRAAIELATEFKLHLVVEGGNEAHRVAAELAAIHADVILRVTALPPVGSTPELPLFHARGEGESTAASVLKAAGVRVALVPSVPSDDQNLLFHAARAMAPGFTREDVLAAVTFNAAAILGVEDSAGSLAVGRTADMAIFASSPLDIGAKPAVVICGGRMVHRVKPRDDLVALTVKRVHTCDGDPIDNATIIIEKGKIRAIGRRVVIPPGATRIVDDSAVVIPGLVDGGTQVGIRGLQQSGDELLAMGDVVGPLGLEQPLAKWFDPTLPTVRAAARAGVTTVALSPGYGRQQVGVLSIVKTGGRVKESDLKAVGGIIWDLAPSQPNAQLRKQLENQLEAGRKYSDAWTEYDKALAEWQKTGKAPQAEPSERKVVGPVGVAKGRDPVSGTWTGTATSPQIPRPIPFTMKAKLDGTSVTGTISTGAGRQGPPREQAFSGTFEKGQLHVTTDVERIKVEVNATIGRDVLTGTISIGPLGEATLEATRVEKPADAETPEGQKDGAKDASGKDPKDAKESSKPVDDGRPKAPSRNEGLEPYRELFADRASAFVGCPTEALAEIAVDVFRSKYSVRLVVLTTGDFKHLIDRYRTSGVALCPSFDSVREDEGVLINPADMAFRNKIPVMLRTAPDGDTRTLYGLGELIVREGVDPEDALRMMTRQPARFLGLLDRVGSLERGKDADMVLLSGEPFEPGTRIRRVMIDGRFIDGGDSR